MSDAPWFSLINRELDGTSDRSAVIVAAAIIDHLLTEAIRSFLVASATAQDTLLDVPNAPLGTFSARIDIAHRLGLLSAQGARDVHIIRRMRNDQAHSLSGQTFSDASLKDQVAHLMRSFAVEKRAPFLLEPPYHTTRGNFMVVVFMIVVYLDDLRKSLPSLKQPQVDALYTTEYKDGGKAGA